MTPRTVSEMREPRRFRKKPVVIDVYFGVEVVPTSLVDLALQEKDGWGVVVPR